MSTYMHNFLSYLNKSFSSQSVPVFVSLGRPEQMKLLTGGPETCVPRGASHHKMVKQDFGHPGITLKQAATWLQNTLPRTFSSGTLWLHLWKTLNLVSGNTQQPWALCMTNKD